MELRSVYTFTQDQIKELLLVCNDEETRRGLMKIHESFKDSTFVYTISEDDINRIRGVEKYP